MNNSQNDYKNIVVDFSDLKKCLENLVSSYKKEKKKTPKKQMESYLKRIFRVWQKHPELRLGQLIMNAVKSSSTVSVYYGENEELVKLVESFYNVTKQKKKGKTNVTRRN